MEGEWQVVRCLSGFCFLLALLGAAAAKFVRLELPDLRLGNVLSDRCQFADRFHQAEGPRRRRRCGLSLLEKRTSGVGQPKLARVSALASGGPFLVA